MLRMYWNRIKSSFFPLRKWIQLSSAAILNGYLFGFTHKTIYTGKLKSTCIPVLNCYSCPGAIGSCPIGALQAFVGGVHERFPFYVLGSMMLFGIILGRVVCGFLCPFGFLQDLLNKIPHPKITIPPKMDKWLRYIKYFIFLFAVILFPAFYQSSIGGTPPYFCKYICPVGTLEGGIPLVILDNTLRCVAGTLFRWKLILLLLILVASIIIPRFFCRYLCPLGAFYGLFHRFSFIQMSLDKEKCTGCMSCEKACPMQVKITNNINSPECIRCGICKRHCSTDAIQYTVIFQNTKNNPL